MNGAGDDHGDLIANAARFGETYTGRGLAAPPARQLVIVTCMDARVDPAALFGLSPGEAHVLRNAGAIVTDDVLRSLVVSQRLLGTRAVFVVAHTECGLHGLDVAAFEATLEASAGERPAWSAGAFTDLDAAVAESLARIRSCPFLVERARVRGFVYDVLTGGLREVDG